MVASSLAKAFGAPVAVLAASDAIVAEFERHSATRVHTSPPSVAAIGAVGKALAVNRRCGDRLRWGLARRVARLRHGLRKLHAAASAGLFPVQPLRLPRQIDASSVHDALRDYGVQVVLHRQANAAAGNRFRGHGAAHISRDRLRSGVSGQSNVPRKAVEIQRRERQVQLLNLPARPSASPVSRIPGGSAGSRG